MNKLLSNLDSIEKGTFDGPVAQDKSEMKAILESLQSVTLSENPIPGAMGAPSMPEPEKVTMNVNMSAQGTDGIADLLKLIGAASTPQEAPMSMPTPMPAKLPAPDTHDDEMGDMKKMMKIASDGPGSPGDSVLDVDIDGDHQPDIALKPNEVEKEDYENEPDEEYADTQTMTRDLAGGLNREKPKSAIRVKDPAVESIKSQLWAALNEKKSNLDEISSDMAKRYTKNAKVDRDNTDDILKRDGSTNDWKANQELQKRNAKRTKGMNRAKKRIEK